MNTYKRHRFPPDIISYAVWLYYRFNLSHRDVEDLLAERGITVSHESIRLWYPKHFVGQALLIYSSPEVMLLAVDLLVRHTGEDFIDVEGVCRESVSL
jgi:hypothetical protein